MERKVVLSICLDDANYLLVNKVLNEILYTILRLYEEFPNARAGVLLPMSSMDIQLPRNSIRVCCRSSSSRKSTSLPTRRTRSPKS